MMREAFSFAEIGRLLADPVFYGAGVPRGDGRRVVVIPGLFGSDLYLEPMRNWLGRLGYAPVRSALSVNAGCLRRLREHVEEEIARRSNGKGETLALIGHSRGGLIARAIAASFQARVSHLVLLGSPIGALRESIQRGENLTPPTQIGRMMSHASTLARRVLDPDCDYPVCDCEFVHDATRRLSRDTKLISIVSRDDQVVSPDSARTPAHHRVEVGGGHVGLVYNPQVYRELGRFLAE